MKPVYKKLLPLIVLAGFIGAAWIVTSNPPQAKRGKPSTTAQLNIEALTVKPAPLTVEISSYGTVQPRTQSFLLPQVSGEITYISHTFRDGGFFEKDEVLVRLDSRDYLAEIRIAESTLLSAEQQLSEEQARVEQAKQDWQRLGNSETAPALVLREPQLKAAQANLISAQATLDKAKLSYERTEIKAPYTGRVLKKSVDIGQVVSQGTQLAEIYAVDYVEIRLPIRNSDLSYISLPETSRFASTTQQVLPPVNFVSDIGKPQAWQGNVVRTEGAFDNDSQQLYVVAQIDDPYAKTVPGALPLKMGQYVKATVTGNTLPNALSIPNKAIYQGSYVYVVENGLLLRKPISIAWQNDQLALIKSGLSADDKLVITPLGQVSSGTPVNISVLDGQPNQTKANKRQAQKKGAKRDKSAQQDKAKVKRDEQHKGAQS